MRWLRYILVLPLICHPGSAHAASPAGARADLAGNPVDFASQIRPVLASKCYQCHGPDESSRKAKLRLDQREDALRELKGRRAIIPGDPGHSELVRRVTLHDGDEQMPPAESHNPVNAEEAALLSRWIRQGAVYSPHWAWMPPRRAPLPPVAPSPAAGSAVGESMVPQGSSPRVAMRRSAASWPTLPMETAGC